MNALAKLANGLLNRKPLAVSIPEADQINYKPRPVVGFFDGLSNDQKAKALAYRGREDHGSTDLLTKQA